MDGIININKPTGPTSYAVVARVKRLTHEARVGHGGTLDPLASGVLPVFLGQATRLMEYLMECHKTYIAEIELGVATDTYDASGRVTGRVDASGVTREKVDEALNSFKGAIQQTPPMYSAVRYQGQPSYKLVRQGISVEAKPRPTHIYCIDLLAFQPPLVSLKVECGKGTYIRSLAHDLGALLGCGAHLKSLVRTKYGPFDINEAVTLSQLEASVRDDLWHTLLHPMDFVLGSWTVVTLLAEQQETVRHGSAIFLGAEETGERRRAYDSDGHLMALLRFDSGAGQWHPEKVFN